MIVNKKLIFFKFLVLVLIIFSITFLSFTEFVFSTGKGTQEQDTVTLPNPLEGTDDPNILIGKIINAILGIVGSLALAMFIYGGLTWMLAAGNNEKVQKGKDILIWTTIGLIVVFSAYALVKLVFTGMGV